MDHMPLKEMLSAIDTFSSHGKFHICIHDVSGILKNRVLAVDKKQSLHSGVFCELAKSTELGFELCQKCKACCNRKAIIKKKPFSGLCSFGIFEFVHPVVIDGKTVCIIYLGNIVTDMNESAKKLEKACRATGSPLEKLYGALRTCDSNITKEQGEKICELIDSYIRLLYEKYKGETITDSPYHWAVYNIKNYADENFTRPITLQGVCDLYFINEKYAGKLFAKQVGKSFHEYLNFKRLEKASYYLLSTNEKIISIALKCGYSDVTYFNRKFRESYGVTPCDYRAGKRKEKTV